MLSFSSILLLYAQIALAFIGVQVAFSIIRKWKKYKEKRYFYTLVLIVPILAQFILGIAGFSTTILFFLSGQETAGLVVRYYFFSILIATWSLLAILSYIFTHQKNKWYVGLVGSIAWASSIVVLSAPVIVENIEGIIAPVKVGWQGMLFTAETIIIFIISFAYLLHGKRRHKKEGKPIGYLNMMQYGIEAFLITFIIFGVYLITDYRFPALYICAWLIGMIATILFFLSVVAIDDESKILLIKPFIFIKRSLRLKMIIYINKIVWITVVGITLVINRLIPKIYSVSQNTALMQNAVKQLAYTQAWLLLISIFILIITTVLIIYFIDALLKPIEYLKQGVKIIGQGNFTYRIMNISYDELGRLAEDFNDMASRLQKKTNKIFRLERIDAIKTQFIETASHQLRTPLTAMRWSLASLLKKEGGHQLSAQADISIKQAYDSTNRMVELVNNLLSMSQLEFNEINPKKKVAIPPLIEEVMQRFNYGLENKKLRVNIQWNPQENFPSILADKAGLLTAFGNIISNAIEYNKRNGIIEIIGSDEGQNVLISFCNTGISIEQKDAENIFSRFYRGQKAIQMKTDGSGLGLHVARSIIQFHKGLIWFQNNADFRNKRGLKTGATFFVRLPKK